MNTIRWTGDEGFAYQDFPRGFFLGGVLITLCVIWLADVRWRLFDVKAVAFARWIAGRCFVGK